MLHYIYNNCTMIVNRQLLRVRLAYSIGDDIGAGANIMAREWNRARLERYIREGIEESLTLEYKSGEALEKSNRQSQEIAKDVSAMANAAGGLIIYGIREHDLKELRHRPVGFRPIDRRECSKETLEQIINSNIQPRLTGVKIYPVTLDRTTATVVYVVAVPQSDTVHQVSSNKRYYKRFNFEAVPMEDYEVRDVLNRASAPHVEPRIGYMSMQPEQASSRHCWTIPVFVKNHSMVVAKDTAMTVEFLDAAPVNLIRAERFVIKTQPQPADHEMYIATFDEAIHRGLNKHFGTFYITVQGPQAIQARLQVFSNGMRAQWWLIKLNFGETSATVQVLEDGYLY
ncbi:MAG: ATP-binding protein [Chloroflexota bacterium]